VQVGKEVSLTALDLSNEEVLVRGIANVSPHWKIFHKHFKEEIVVDSFLELLKLGLVKRSLAQKAPVDGIHKRDFVGRRLATVTNNGFSETLSMALGTKTLLAQDIRIQVYILFCSSFLLFLFRRMLMAERERVVAVSLGRVIERSVRKKREALLLVESFFHQPNRI
jgi:hypothetical protein